MAENAGTAVAEAHDAISTAIAATAAAVSENADTEVQRALEHAEQQISAAEQAAETIALAALQSQLAQQLQEFKTEIRTWLDQLAGQLSKLPALETEITEIKGQLSATALLAVTPNSSLIPPQSAPQKVEEAITEVAEILPNSLSESAVEESPVPEIKRRRKVFL